MDAINIKLVRTTSSPVDIAQIVSIKVERDNGIYWKAIMKLMERSGSKDLSNPKISMDSRRYLEFHSTKRMGIIP